MIYGSVILSVAKRREGAFRDIVSGAFFFCGLLSGLLWFCFLPERLVEVVEAS